MLNDVHDHFSYAFPIAIGFVWYSSGFFLWLRGFACHGGKETDLALLTQSQHAVAGAEQGIKENHRKMVVFHGDL